MGKQCFQFQNENGNLHTSQLLESLRNKVRVYRVDENPPEDRYQGVDIIIVDSEIVKDFYKALKVEKDKRGNIKYCMYGDLTKLKDGEFWESRLSEEKRIL